MKCPYCKESIKNDSLKCKHCHADITTEEAKKMIKEGSKMSPLVKFGGGFLLIIFIIGVISGGGGSSGTSSSSNSQQYPAITAELPKDNTWEYESKTDKLSGKPLYFARLESNELLNFDFPYQGPQPITLVLRNNADKSNDVMFIIEKGQFTGTYNNETISVRFDDGTVEKVSYSGPNDGSSNAIFINNAESFLKKLRKSKKLIISAIFYDQGNHTVTFNTADVKF